MNVVVIVLGAVAAVGVIGWMFLQRNVPEEMSTHDDTPPTTTSEELYEGADRPAGPDAEVMDPDALGGDHRPPASSSPEADAEA
ncbi:MAG: hypothetical protein ABJH68_07075 [Ilumatobacter sp.]|uniref:hypothetical protein n=1 Tax=Ilumatobacter sp. TaxID=1967498 RepID=UPI003297E99A